ncbi:hypothetical protein LTS15_009076 [Exophiala xenobiotica]|nr:hypothetical protein LTS15_009076 [Exophiala xenobiotica]
MVVTRMILTVSSAYPYCGLLSYTQDGAVSFFCTDAPSLTFVAAYETEASVSSSQSAQATQSSSSDVVSSPSTSSMVISSSTSSTTPSPVPFTQSQQTAGTTTQPSAAATTTTTTTSISGASGMLVLSDSTRIFMILAMTMAVVLVICQ